MEAFSSVTWSFNHRPVVPPPAVALVLLAPMSSGTAVLEKFKH